jgi:hypothetical protein
MLEVLKYHFEPLRLKNDEGEYDADLLINMAIALKGKRLFNRFGMMQSTAKYKSPYSKYLNADAKLDQVATPDELGIDEQIMPAPAAETSVLLANSVQPNEAHTINEGSETQANYEPDRYYLVHMSKLRYSFETNTWYIPPDSIPLATDNIANAMAMLIEYATKTPNIKTSKK